MYTLIDLKYTFIQTTASRLVNLYGIWLFAMLIHENNAQLFVHNERVEVHEH